MTHFRDKLEEVHKITVDFTANQNLEEVSKSGEPDWGKEFCSAIPSFFPYVGRHNIRFFKPVNGKIPHITECIDFIYFYNFHFLNIQGLIIVKSLDQVRDFIPINTFVLSPDKLKNLFQPKSIKCVPTKFSERKIPFFHKMGKGVYECNSLPYGITIEADEWVIAAEKVIIPQGIVLP